jgi:hypothetical protein
MTRTIPKYLMKMWEGVEVVEIVAPVEEMDVVVEVVPAIQSPTLASL